MAPYETIRVDILTRDTVIALSIPALLPPIAAMMTDVIAPPTKGEQVKAIIVVSLTLEDASRNMHRVGT